MRKTLVSSPCISLLVNGFISLKGGGVGEKYSDPDFHWFLSKEEKKGSNDFEQRVYITGVMIDNLFTFEIHS